MENTSYRAIAIVGAGAILPDAPNVPAFWENIKNGRYSVTEIDPARWDPALYYDPDPSVPDKTYSKIGGWVRDYVWDPMKWHLAIPPRVCLQPAADCLHDLLQAGNTTAAHGNGDTLAAQLLGGYAQSPQSFRD